MRESLLEGRGPTWNEPEAEKVYSITQVVDSQGRINYIQESGDLTDAWAKVVNPSSMAALSSGFLYHEGSFERLDEDGTTHKYHEVTRSPFVPGEVSQPQPFRFGAGIEDWITSGDGSEREVTVLLRTFEEWDIPPRPDSRVLSIADMASATMARTQALETRRQRVADIVAALQPQLRTVIQQGDWLAGAFTVTMSGEEAIGLSAHPVIAALAFVTETQNNFCTAPASFYTTAFTTSWFLGQGRRPSRTNVDSYLSQGWKGERLNPARHALGGIAVAAFDAETFEDEMLGFKDNAFATSRIIGRFDCNVGTCASTPNFAESGILGEHGTQTASVVFGDFQNQQANGVAYGDPYYSSVGDNLHCVGFEEAASGMAPEAIGALFANLSTNGRASNATAVVIANNYDIISMPLDFPGSTCDVRSLLVEEIALENAFDDGVFIVNAPNTELPPGSCNLRSPADTPKVFVVNALNTAALACIQNYQECLFLGDATGGGDLQLANGSTSLNGLSGIDLSAPGSVRYVPSAGEPAGTTDWGAVLTAQWVGGTSISAPHVAGAAAIVKDGFLAGGWSFINSPGRLHTMMLAMGDRANGANSKLNNGADNKYGMGRLKLHRTSEINGGWGMWTYTFAPSSGNFLKNPFGTAPLRTGTDFVKCVMFESEDMSSKATVGDHYLEMYKGDPVSGSCPLVPHNQQTIGRDGSYDLKHMTAYEGSLSNKCVYFEIVNALVAGAALTTNTYCYYGDQNDAWPL